MTKTIESNKYSQLPEYIMRSSSMLATKVRFLNFQQFTRGFSDANVEVFFVRAIRDFKRLSDIVHDVASGFYTQCRLVKSNILLIHYI